MANNVASERLWILDTAATLAAAGVEVIVRKIVFTPASIDDDVLIQEYGPAGTARSSDEDQGEPYRRQSGVSRIGARRGQELSTDSSSATIDGGDAGRISGDRSVGVATMTLAEIISEVRALVNEISTDSGGSAFRRRESPGADGPRRAGTSRHGSCPHDTRPTLGKRERYDG
ncbi:MAG: hypothetical protein MZV70_36105 [Desulfobacterales bacterium]|nr:hypothetical protein [Desulfobacterales bacterium]